MPLGIPDAIAQGALEFAGDLIQIGWTQADVVTGVQERYRWLDASQAAHLVQVERDALAAAERAEGRVGSATLGSLGLPSVPGIPGGEVQVDYHYEWEDPSTGRRQTWYDRYIASPGDTIDEVLAQLADTSRLPQTDSTPPSGVDLIISIDAIVQGG